MEHRRGGGPLDSYRGKGHLKSHSYPAVKAMPGLASEGTVTDQKRMLLSEASTHLKQLCDAGQVTTLSSFEIVGF